MNLIFPQVITHIKFLYVKMKLKNLDYVEEEELDFQVG